MVIFDSYVKLPEGIRSFSDGNWLVKHRKPQKNPSLCQTQHGLWMFKLIPSMDHSTGQNDAWNKLLCWVQIQSKEQDVKSIKRIWAITPFSAHIPLLKNIAKSYDHHMTGE